MPDWTISDYDDRGVIPDITMPKEKLDAEFPAQVWDHSDRIRADLKYRMTKLRRMKLLKGDEVTPLGHEFIAHCLQHYVKVNGKLALQHDTDPLSYPEVEEERTAYGKTQPRYYWEAMGDANDTLRRQVFECEGWALDIKPVDDALDENSRFGRYHCRNGGVNGRERQHWYPNWECFSQNSAQFLISDYDFDHFSDLINDGDWAPEILDDYESQAEAFADVYYELWALYLWSLHYQRCTHPQELMYQWRWNLCHGFESRLEEVYDALHLGPLTALLSEKDGQAPVNWLGPITSIKEWGADSDANFNRIEAYTTALERVVEVFYAEIADLMRAHGAVVIKTGGVYQVSCNNGAELDPKPVIDTAREVLTRPTGSSFPFHSEVGARICGAVYKALRTTSTDKKISFLMEIAPEETPHEGS